MSYSFMTAFVNPLFAIGATVIGITFLLGVLAGHYIGVWRERERNL